MVAAAVEAERDLGARPRVDGRDEHFAGVGRQRKHEVGEAGGGPGGPAVVRRSIEAAETGRSGNPQLAGEAADQRAERAQAGRVGGDQRLPRRARRVEDRGVRAEQHDDAAGADRHRAAHLLAGLRLGAHDPAPVAELLEDALRHRPHVAGDGRVDAGHQRLDLDAFARLGDGADGVAVQHVDAPHLAVTDGDAAARQRADLARVRFLDAVGRRPVAPAGLGPRRRRGGQRQYRRPAAPIGTAQSGRRRAGVSRRDAHGPRVSNRPAGRHA